MYDYVSYFDRNQLAKVILNSKYGFIDKTGKIIIPIIYDTNNSRDVESEGEEV
jgi:hypothetical protein